MSLTRRILALAWPVLVGQFAVMLASTIDTIMTGHSSPQDLAALAVGSAVYTSVYVGMMGIIMGLNPLVANRLGAGDPEAAGRSFVDGLWVAAALALAGGVLIGLPGLWTRLAQVSGAVAERVDHYLIDLVIALPAALAFRVVYAFNTAIGRPKLLMIINLVGLLMKVPLDYLLVYGHLGLPALGAPGCAIATAIVMWTSCLLSVVSMMRDPHYREFQIRFAWPHAVRIRQLLAIGIPTGMGYIVEVTAFTGMALIAARLGASVTGAHQIAANLAALCYMVPMSLSVSTATLVAQALGARDGSAAARTYRVGLALACALALTLSGTLFLSRQFVVRLYTGDAAVAQVALNLICIVVVFHLFDAQQSVASFVMRAYGKTVLPMLVNTALLWGLGLLGGWFVTFHPLFAGAPMGIEGLWLSATLALGLVCVTLVTLAFRLVRRVRANPALIPVMGADLAH